MALNLHSPAEISDRNVAWMKANNPFYHQKRFEIQVHKGEQRENIYLPTWQLVAIVLSTKKFAAEDPRRPDRVIVSDNRDTYSRVLEFEKCWYGYETKLCRGAARGEEPQGWCEIEQPQILLTRCQRLGSCGFPDLECICSL